MKATAFYLYKGKLVFVTNWTYESNGRVSNWVDFRFVRKDGSLGKSGGDNAQGQFRKAKGWRLVAQKIHP